MMFRSECSLCVAAGCAAGAGSAAARGSGDAAGGGASGGARRRGSQRLLRKTRLRAAAELPLRSQKPKPNEGRRPARRPSSALGKDIPKSRSKSHRVFCSLGRFVALRPKGQGEWRMALRCKGPHQQWRFNGMVGGCGDGTIAGEEQFSDGVAGWIGCALTLSYRTVAVSAQAAARQWGRALKIYCLQTFREEIIVRQARQFLVFVTLCAHGVLYCEERQACW